MSAMTLFLLFAATFVAGIGVGAFFGWLLGHDDGVDDGMRAARAGKEWSI